MILEISLISHTRQAGMNGARCGHQGAAVRDEMHRETLFAGRLRLSPNVASRQHFCSNKLSEEDLRGAEARIQNTMKAAAEAGVDKIQDKMICGTCKEEATDWTRLTTIVIWQVSAVHTNCHLTMYNPSPVHVPPCDVYHVPVVYIRKALYNTSDVIGPAIHDMYQAQPILSAMQIVQQRSFNTNAVAHQGQRSRHRLQSKGQCGC